MFSFQKVDTLTKLQMLYDELVESADACQLDRYTASNKAGRSRWLWSRFLPQSSYSLVKGLYLYGGVGTGKTMLMDLFFDQLPCNRRKKRIHFHDFMLNVHSRLQILVATSNRAPDNLYEGGLQRDLFLPFISTLKAEKGYYFVGNDLSASLKVPGVSWGAYPWSARGGSCHVEEITSDVRKQGRLLCSAEGSPLELFDWVVTIADAQQMSPRTSSRSRKNDYFDLCVDNELGFAKDRTISRTKCVHLLS